MKTRVIMVVLALVLSAGCHFHLDFLGKSKMEEVTLIKSQAREKILLLDISGVIGSRLQPGIFEREANILSRVNYRLEKAAEDPLVRAIILRLDTPGGEVTTSDILHNRITQFQADTKIPVVALMMGTAASGGYYIANACDHIIAHPSTITGSIGVISLFPNLGELMAKIGVEVNVIKSGRMKDSGSIFRELAPEEEEVFQEIVDSYYEKFLEIILEGRKGSISYEELKPLADGRVYTAPQALQLKLIDEIGYFDDAYQKALSLARLRSAAVVSYTYFPKSKTNIYATQIQEFPTMESLDLDRIFQSLQSGFYYLWLPGLSESDGPDGPKPAF